MINQQYSNLYPIEYLTYLWDGDLVSLLEMLGESFDEILCRDVFDGVTVRVDSSEMLLIGEKPAFRETSMNLPP